MVVADSGSTADSTVVRSLAPFVTGACSCSGHPGDRVPSATGVCPCSDCVELVLSGTISSPSVELSRFLNTESQ